MRTIMTTKFKLYFQPFGNSMYIYSTRGTISSQMFNEGRSHVFCIIFFLQKMLTSMIIHRELKHVLEKLKIILMANLLSSSRTLFSKAGMRRFPDFSDSGMSRGT